MTFFDKVKQKIWNVMYAFFLPVRSFLFKLGIIWHKKKRQRYHLGWLAPGKTLAGLKKHLHEKWGFVNMTFWRYLIAVSKAVRRIVPDDRHPRFLQRHLELNRKCHDFPAIDSVPVPLPYALSQRAYPLDLSSHSIAIS